MRIFSPSAHILVAGVLVCAADGCKSRDHNEARVELSAPGGTVNGGKNDPNWIYNGKLPHLVDARIVVSLKSHTARVTGWAPADFDASSLPDYVHVEDIGGRKRLMVVYPVATVDPVKAPNGNAPGSYYDVLIYPFTPQGTGQDETVPWGGFPYIEYDHGRNIAFHGPIDSNGGFWRLRRGPVSHACNRMQGEHVTEMAHLLGTDMTVHRTNKNYSETKLVPAGSLVPLVLVTEEFDKIVGGTLDGKLVDVDYPVFNNPSVDSNLQVKRPTGNVQLFNTWDARSNPTWVCASQKDRAKDGAKHCADLVPTSGGSGPTGSDTKICPGVGQINVRNGALGFLASAQEGEPVRRLGKVQKDSTGLQFEKVFFINEPSGPGWIASKFLPPCK